MNLQKWKIGDITKWCVDNGEVAWLKEEAAKKVEHKVYPKVESVSKNGKKSWKSDKTQEPKIVVEPISFIELKQSFVKKFFPEEVAKRENKKADWHDMIANL